jgi:hypothetical protein
VADPVGQPPRQRAVVAAGVRPIRLHDAWRTAITLMLAAGAAVRTGPGRGALESDDRRLDRTAPDALNVIRNREAPRI